MKKNLLLFTLACFFSIQSKAQYASVWAGYPPSYEMSTGFATRHTPGTFWLGYLSSVQNIQTSWHVNKNFCIMGSGLSSIWAAYKIFDANNCSGSLSQVLNGYGISAVETTGPNNLRYALAGSYDQACYFTTLDKWGNVMADMSYPFPSAVSGKYSDPSKPIIVESASPNEYYICGYFEGNMYVINVKSNGTIIWSNFYTLFNGITPKDIIMNPFDPKELIVVGETEVSSGDNQAFFMALEGSSGAIKQTKLYGSALMPDGFATIIAGASNPVNNDGFIIGGYTQALGGTAGKAAWVCKLDPAGNMIWSNLLTPSTGANGSVIDIVERLNTSGKYEYYALLDANVGMQVLKLDEGGTPFHTSAPNALYNEFVYDLPSSAPSKPTNISYVNSPALTADVGIQVFGTASNFSGFSSSYVVSAYFNGETNCYRTLTTINSVEKGPGVCSPVTAGRYGSFTECTNFQVLAYFPGGSVNYPCMGLMTSGNNQRSMPAGISPEENINEDFSVFPNPVTDKATVNYSVQDNSTVKIELYNLVGQHVKSLQPEHEFAGTYQQEIDFDGLQLQNGIYFVHTTVDGTVHKQKIVYAK